MLLVYHTRFWSNSVNLTSFCVKCNVTNYLVLEQWHSIFCVPVIPQVIPLQICTPKLVGVYFKKWGQAVPPLWSSGQSSWLQVQKPGFDSLHYQIFWEVVGLERIHLASSVQLRSNLKKSSGSGLESREYGRRDSSRWPRCTFSLQKLAVTSSTSGGRSVGIVRSRTKATEFSLV
jgi:hypothetical protein